MDLSPSGLMATLRSETGQKAIKYSGVSLIGVVLTFVILSGLQLAGTDPTIANMIAVAVTSIPCYVLNRAWVWGKSGKNDWAREILPYWGFAFAGFVASTLLVNLASKHVGHLVLVPHSSPHRFTRDYKLVDKFIIDMANLAGFGSLWIARFFVLDRLLFGKDKIKGETVLEHLAEDAPFA